MFEAVMCFFLFFSFFSSEHFKKHSDNLFYYATEENQAWSIMFTFQGPNKLPRTLTTFIHNPCFFSLSLTYHHITIFLTDQDPTHNTDFSTERLHKPESQGVFRVLDPGWILTPPSEQKAALHLFLYQ